MTVLRKRMLDDLQLRGYAERTQGMYVRAVRMLAQHYRKSPDRITEQELRDYFIHVKNVRKWSRATLTISLCGIKFFFEQTLGRELARHERLELIEAPANAGAGCADDEDCKLSQLADQGVSLVLRAHIDPEDLHWSLHETWSPALVKRGSIAIGPGTEVVTVRRESFSSRSSMPRPWVVVTATCSRSQSTSTAATSSSRSSRRWLRR